MYTLLVILIVIAAVLMIGIVLIQESKGGGLSSNFSSQNNLLGVRKTTDVVEKTTWALAAALVVISVACAYMAPGAANGGSVLAGEAVQTEMTNPENQPGIGATATPDAAATETPAETPAPEAAQQ